MLGNKIFKRDTNGSMRTWNYEVQGEAWRSHSGVDGGAVVTSGWTRCEPKSKPTAEEQALFEAQAEHGKKLDKDYALTREGVDEGRDFGDKPMLAHKFEGLIRRTGTFSQPKLDGMRCKMNRHGLWSRTGKPIFSCPHIFSILAPAAAANPDFAIDGELYNHDLKDDFPKLMSILRKSKPTDADIEEAAKTAQFHVYDLFRADKTFSQRDQMLDLFVAGLDRPEIVKVPTTPIFDMAQLDAAYAAYLADGYEGQMVRFDEGYEFKRSKNLLKRKEMTTEEFELIDIMPGNGNWAGLAKRVVFRMHDGQTCGGGIKGNRENALKLLERREQLIGKKVTVQHFTGPFPDELSDGKLRFPVAIDFDRPDA